MKKFSQMIRIVFLTFLIFSLENCSKEAEVETPIIDTSGTNLDADDVAIRLEDDLQVSDYIWQGLNYFYYWQTSVPELADSKLNDERTYAEFINQNSKNKKDFGGLIGQLVDLETGYAFKKLFNKLYNSQLVDFRQKDILFDTSDEFNFTFNTSINKIDQCDFILLIGCNPRLEATIVNYRIRKAVNSGCNVFSIGDPGDQNYYYLRYLKKFPNHLLRNLVDSLIYKIFALYLLNLQKIHFFLYKMKKVK